MTGVRELRVLEQSPRAERQRLHDAQPVRTPSLDARALAADLARTVRGEVRFGDGDRALYATDASNYRQTPIGVVVPRDADDVIAAVAAARRHGAPIVSRGGGTSLAGQACNAAVVLDFSKYVNRVHVVDAAARTAVVEPGCVLDRFRTAVGDELTFGPDPATHTHCTIGGMLGNNSCGVHSLLSVQAGLGQRTSDNTAALEILTYDGLRMHVGPTPPDELAAIIAAGGRRGEIYAALDRLVQTYGDEIRERYPRLPRRVSGYNLDDLLPENGFNVARALVGTEGTCVTILGATLHLVPAPRARALLLLGYEDAFRAADHVMRVLEFAPVGLEGIDRKLYDYVDRKGEHRANLELLPEGDGWLLVEFGGDTREEAAARARECRDALARESDAPTSRIYDRRAEEEQVWEVREGALGSTAWVPGLPDMWPGWEDSAVAPERLGGYLRDLRALLDRFGYDPSLYGHFGQGCVHCRIDFDLYTAEGIAKYRAFAHEAADLVVRHGGSFSGEHGDGQARAELLPKMFGGRLVGAMEEFKSIWDPGWKMNPGKVVRAHGITEHLRIGADYAPPEPVTHFQYPDDEGSFGRAALRCVGVGRCRRPDGGTMCPSYMVTGEEKHSTRGRARLLWEMLNGEVLTDGWRSEPVKEALDLCLSCKGCKHDCPVAVDIATYRAEFLSHYWSGRIRPRSAFAFGFVHWWARLAGLTPGLANAVASAPGLGRLVRWAADIAPERELPAFAPETFRHRFARRAPRNPNGPPVILWPDTFNNWFHADTAIAAADVLEEAGFRVLLPRGDYCCGRPLYEYGFLDTARRWLVRIMHGMRAELEAGIPIVVLEPSCATVFRDELRSLFPDDPLAGRLAEQTLLLSEFLERHAPDWAPPPLGRRALVQGHCHHKAIMGLEAEARVLERAGVEAECPDTGCCGMAGAFGFEAGERYEVSIRCGERALFPAVREAADATLIVADGFSCREQIRQGTRREALHLAEVLRMAMNGGAPGDGRLPESVAVARREAGRQRARRRAALTIGAGAVAVAGVLAFRARQRDGQQPEASHADA